MAHAGRVDGRCQLLAVRAHRPQTSPATHLRALTDAWFPFAPFPCNAGSQVFRNESGTSQKL